MLQGLIPWNTVILEKVIVTWIIKNSPSFMESEASIPFSQEPATGPYPE